MKIDVITVKLTCHIPVNPGDVGSVQNAAGRIERLAATAAALGETIIETRVARVTAPELEASEPAEPPENLRRKSKPEQPAAE